MSDWRRVLFSPISMLSCLSLAGTASGDVELESGIYAVHQYFHEAQKVGVFNGNVLVAYVRGISLARRKSLCRIHLRSVSGH
jgi:hypothetical protein